MIGPSRLQTAEEFGNILLKVNPDGSQVRLHDVATVSLGGENYSTDTKYNGKPASTRYSTPATAGTLPESIISSGMAAATL